MSTIYGIAFAVSLIMIGVYLFFDRQHDKWLGFLFVSVALCNAGYLLLSLSNTLNVALRSNRIAYLGNVFLPFFLLMMIMNLSRFICPKWLPKVLIFINTAMLFIATSGGYLTIYYKNVSLDFVDGYPILVKEYGPLHNLYKVYLFLYFGAMLSVIIYTAVKKSVVSSKHTAFLLFVVIGNVAIWLVENIIHSSFEFLSISYIVTEGMIIFLYGTLQDYGLADNQHNPQHNDIAAEPQIENKTVNITNAFEKEQIDSILKNWSEVDNLSQREKEVLCFLLENKKRKVIAETLFVTESTIKKHTSSVYRKLSVSNRTELFEKAKEYLINVTETT